MSIPFQDAEFDAVLCQNGLQFMPDRRLALREMLRVLKPARRLALSVNGHEYGSEAIAPAVDKFLGPDAAAIFREPFVLGNADALALLFDGLGCQSVEITRETITAHYPSADAFLDFALHSRFSLALEKLPPDHYAALIQDAHARLAQFVGKNGLAFPIEMLVVVARS